MNDSSQQHSKPLLLRSLLAGAAALAALAITWWIWSPDATTDYDMPATFTPAVREHATELETQWRAADFIAISEADASPSVIHTSLEPRVLDPHGLLSDEMRESLLHALTAQLLARAAPDASPYLAAMESDPADYTLAEPDSDALGKARAIYEYEIGQAPGESDSTQDILERLWRKCIDEEGFRFKEIGAGGENGVIIIRRFRVREELLDSGLLDFPEESLHLFSAPLASAAATFHTKTVDLPEYLAARPAAVGANVHLLVRCGNDLMMDWMTDWWWDEQRRVWTCDRMGWKSARVMRLFF